MAASLHANALPAASRRTPGELACLALLVGLAVVAAFQPDPVGRLCRGAFPFIFLAAAAWYLAVPIARTPARRAALVVGNALCASAALVMVGDAGHGASDILQPLFVLTACVLVLLLALDRGRLAWRARPLRAAAAMLVASAALLLAGAMLLDGACHWLTELAVSLLALAALSGVVESLLHWRQVARTNERQRDFAHVSRLAVVGELTGAIAHEINQPLGAISSNADAGEMLLERMTARGAEGAVLDELRQILSDIRRDALRASGVIRHVRTLAGRRELTFERLDAKALAIDTVHLLEPDMLRRGIAVELSLQLGEATLRGDRAYLEQALINLLLNAMDATEGRASSPTDATPPAIVLGVRRSALGAIEFRVVDRGHGIPAEHLPKLFHSFNTTKAHGMGLGLSIARSIVEAHGGTIRAENNAGPGATFRIVFPPVAAGSDPGADEADDAGGGGHPGSERPTHDA